MVLSQRAYSLSLLLCILSLSLFANWSVFAHCMCCAIKVSFVYISIIPVPWSLCTSSPSLSLSLFADTFFISPSLSPSLYISEWGL
mmetsp:Transcript_26718/g.67151  ORF Transcript_26718/g.67151 Transcript_26718/m.67151 type:complete len:86 (+) Transcript_26718:25-282(+)